MQDDLTFEIGGLTRIDSLRLREIDGVSIREDTLPAGTYGEPVSFTLVVTVGGLATLAAYLLRKHRGESFEEEITTTHPDGRKEHRRVRWSKSASEAPDVSIMKAITSSFSLGG